MLTAEELAALLDYGGLVSHWNVSTKEITTRSIELGPFVVEEETFYRIGHPEEVEDYQLTVNLPALEVLQYEGQRWVSRVVYLISGKVRLELLNRAVSYLGAINFIELLGLGERIQVACSNLKKSRSAWERL